mgnify:CR=1 FL=1
MGERPLLFLCVYMVNKNLLGLSPVGEVIFDNVVVGIRSFVVRIAFVLGLAFACVGYAPENGVARVVI